MRLAVVPGKLAVCRLSPDQQVPAWVWEDRTFLAITYTADELSIVCSAKAVPAGVEFERNWKAIKVLGPLDFSLTGILATLATPLAVGDVPIFAVSTYDTDYILVKEQDIARARALLARNGHTFEDEEQK